MLISRVFVTKMQVGCKYANYEEGVVKIFHIFFEVNVWFPQPFFQTWACLQMRLFHRKNDIFCGWKQRRRNEQRNQQKTRKYACDIKKQKTWRSSVSCLSATYLVSYASFVVKQHCHKVRFCGCKQRRRNEQWNQQKTRKYVCDIKKPKNVAVLKKRKRLCMAWM